MGHPLYFSIPNTEGQSSYLSAIPSPSKSGQPFRAIIPAISGHSSWSSGMPSLSLSFNDLLVLLTIIFSTLSARFGFVFFDITPNMLTPQATRGIKSEKAWVRYCPCNRKNTSFDILRSAPAPNGNTAEVLEWKFVTPNPAEKYGLTIFYLILNMH